MKLEAEQNIVFQNYVLAVFGLYTTNSEKPYTDYSAKPYTLCWHRSWALSTFLQFSPFSAVFKSRSAITNP